jgi:hypothetical protein
MAPESILDSFFAKISCTNCAPSRQGPQVGERAARSRMFSFEA